MSDQRPTENECWKTRISYTKGHEIVHIEHFGEKGQLLSEIHMDYEAAYDYARMIYDVADHALGVE